MKKCIRCGKLFDNEINYCTNCGSSNFYEEDEDSSVLDKDTDLLTEDEGVTGLLIENDTRKALYYDGAERDIAVNNRQIALNAHEIKPKKNIWKIIAIPLIAIILFFVVLLIIPVDETGVDNSDYGTEMVTYTKGVIEDGYYLNEWAGIKICIPDGWFEAEIDEYLSFESEVMDCGFNIKNKDSQIVLCFEDLAINVSEEQYVEFSQEGLEEIYDTNGLNYHISEIYNSQVAGEEYKTIKITVGENILHQYIAVRKIGNHMLSLTITSTNDDEAQAIMNSIEEYKNY